MVTDYPEWFRNRPVLVNRYNYFTPNKVNPALINGGAVDQHYTGYEKVISYRTRKQQRLSSMDQEFSDTSGSHFGFLRELATENHYSPSRNGRARDDNGHSFLSEKHKIDYPNQDVNFISPTGTYGYLRYRGLAIPCAGELKWPEPVFPSEVNINSDGANLIRMTIPTAPEAGMAQFFSELGERLPAAIGTLISRKGLSTRTIGGEYLNEEFGLKPFIKDLQSLANAVLEANRIVSRYKANADKIVRRRARLASSTWSQDVVNTGTWFDLAFPGFPGIDVINYFFKLPLPELVIRDQFFNDVWFSGAYQYHLHQGHTFLGKMARYEELANALLGTRITEDTVWELTPWSWLVDWFSDTGTFISNVTALSNDSLVLRYGYVMHETRALRIMSRVGLQPKYSDGSVPGSLSVFLETSRKTRNRATPYGFGVDLSALSARRLAILAALGMTKTG
jgi:hypothetical protein